MKKIILVFSILLLAPIHFASAVQLYNPLGNGVNNFPALVNNVIKGVLGLTGAVALVMIVIGGVTWMTSAGNADRVRRGKDTLLWAILGLIIIFISYAVIDFVFKALLNGQAA
ncbi:hypothetical protein H6761_03770 [Candidatus Nomurabacteria bacterium]|nr:hypothetical protein [Candidatus Nomurabacteria bacterium]